VSGLAVVYSSDCPSALKYVTADSAYVWQCSGTGDQVQINAAINAVQATGQTSSTPPSGGGGSVLLLGNTFGISAPIQLQSWVDLGGAIGNAGCHINCASGFTGTAMIQDAQTYTERTSLHDLYLDGKGVGSVHGIYRNSQVSQTPFTYSDPKHRMRDLTVMNPGGGGIVFGTSVRSTLLRDCHIEQAAGWGLDGSGLIDSVVTGLHLEGNGTAGTSGGIQATGGSTCYSGCRVYNSHGYGISGGAARISFANVVVIDSSYHNWYITAGKMAMSHCHSDSASLGSTATYHGFYFGSALTDIQAYGCTSYDRNGTPHQGYGVYINGTAPTNSRLYVQTYGNATGSFGGTTTPGSGSVYDIYGS